MATIKLIQTGAIAAISVLFPLGSTYSAHAVTLTFDDLLDPPQWSSELVPSNYAGFTWNNFGYDSTPPTDSGYINAVISQSTVLFNGRGRSADFSRSEVFDFNSVYLTAAWNNGLNVLVSGFVGGTQTYSRSVTVNTTSATLFNFDFLGVDRVQFTSTGGTPAGFRNGFGTHFALDNLTFNTLQPIVEPPAPVLPPPPAPPAPAAEAVPEPTTLAGVALAGAGLTALRRKRRSFAKAPH